MAFVVTLSEILTVALSGVPFSSAQSYTTYLFSTYLSVVIIVLMLIALMIVIFRRDDLVLPHQPGTMLVVLFCLCNSSMIPELDVLSALETRTTNQKILDLGQTYKYGRVTDLDGGMTYGIDYETSNKRHFS